MSDRGKDSELRTPHPLEVLSFYHAITDSAYAIVYYEGQLITEARHS